MIVESHRTLDGQVLVVDLTWMVTVLPAWTRPSVIFCQAMPSAWTCWIRSSITRTVTRAYVDAGFKDDIAIHGAVHGITVEQVKRNTTATGFVPVAKRWVVERTYGTLTLRRRLMREYELPRDRGNSYYPEVLVIPS
jgi:hypothetical protein